MRNASDACCCDAHDRGGNQRILAAGNVAADHLDRDDLLSQRDAVAELRLELRQQVALPLRELGHLLLAVGEILLERHAQRVSRRCDLILRYAKLGSCPAVQLRRVFANRLVPIPLDIGDHLAHSLDELAIVLSGRRSSLLQIAHHCSRFRIVERKCNRLHCPASRAFRYETR